MNFSNYTTTSSANLSRWKIILINGYSNQIDLNNFSLPRCFATSLLPALVLILLLTSLILSLPTATDAQRASSSAISGKRSVHTRRTPNSRVPPSASRIGIPPRSSHRYKNSTTRMGVRSVYSPLSARYSPGVPIQTSNASICCVFKSPLIYILSMRDYAVHTR